MKLDSTLVSSPSLDAVLQLTLTYYATSGYSPPWVSYLGVDGQKIVGTAAFKSKPKGNQVEIAYFTFPEYEGLGYATQMVGELVRLAHEVDRYVVVKARTLIERNASHRVLEKSGFSTLGTVIDPDDGEVLEWEYLERKS